MSEFRSLGWLFIMGISFGLFGGVMVTDLWYRNGILSGNQFILDKATYKCANTNELKAIKTKEKERESE